MKKWNSQPLSSRHDDKYILFTMEYKPFEAGVLMTMWLWP